MTRISNIDVTYASDVIRDGFFAEFWCGEEMWGEMEFDITSDNYDNAYLLTIYPLHSSEPLVLSVAELERLIQIAKWRLTPIPPADEG